MHTTDPGIFLDVDGENGGGDGDNDDGNEGGVYFFSLYVFM